MRIAWHVKRPTSSTVKRMAAARGGNEQISRRAAGSEPGRPRVSKAMPENQAHAVTALGKRSSSEERGLPPMPTDPMGLVLHNSTRVYFSEREIEKFIIRQPPMGEKDDYDSENSWISRRSQD